MPRWISLLTLSLSLTFVAVAAAAPVTWAAGAESAAASTDVRRYAIIVANNRSVDRDLAPLHYADDDGAKFFELFTALGAQVSFFAVLDPDAQQRFPDAAAVAQPPRREAVLTAMAGVFGRLRDDARAGAVTELYFVFSGHGGLGPNREGYLSFLDAPFSRSDLYRELLARSPATWNHVILDACYAYFMVEKKGRATDKTGNYAGAVWSFLRNEELASYPNTGIILAATEDAETHEWSRWRSGIFSHELRSALLGAGDVDGDGAVSYAEAAAAVEAANAAIDDAQARLRVYARPPAARINQPLIDTGRLAPVGRLRFERGMQGHFYVQDGRGVRVADLHPAGENETRLALVGTAPFYLRQSDFEAELSAAKLTAADDVVASRLSFQPLAAANKGSVESSFRNQLYAVGFGQSFFQGMLAVRGPGLSDWDGWYGSDRPPEVQVGVAAAAVGATRWRATAGWIGVGLGAGAAAGGIALGVLSDSTYAEYQAASDPKQAKQLKAKTERESLGANALFGVAAVTALAGAGLLVWEWLAPASDAAPPVTPVLMLDGTGAQVGVGWQW